MFRTWATRGKSRFLTLIEGKTLRNATISLTQSEIKLIESSKLLSLGEKIELLLIALGNKLTGEIYAHVSYNYDKKAQINTPNQTTINQLQSFLLKLPYSVFIDQEMIKDKRTQKDTQFTWFQVSINQNVQLFMQKFGLELTEYEEGVLYGFPISAIRACGGLIEEDTSQPKTAAEYFLSGVRAKEFRKEELSYYKKTWGELKKLSPKVVLEAEKLFLQEGKPLNKNRAT